MHAQIQPIKTDLTDVAAVDSLVATRGDFDACIYLAANGDPAASDAQPGFDLRANTVALVNLLERVHVGQFVFFSSGAVYDRISGPVDPVTPVCPRLPYAISKLASEQYLHHFLHKGHIAGLVIARFFGAYGSYEPPRKIYNRLIRRFAFERDPHFTVRGDGRNLIDAMHVDDAVRAIHLLLAARSGAVTLDLASHAPLTLSALVHQAARSFGLEADICFTGEVPEYNEFYSTDTRMRDEYGFEPTIGVGDGLRRFAQTLREAQ